MPIATRRARTTTGPNRAALVIVAALSIGSTACELAWLATERSRSHRQREDERLERAAARSKRGVPLRTDWRCAPTERAGAATIDCTFRALVRRRLEFRRQHLQYGR